MQKIYKNHHLLVRNLGDIADPATIRFSQKSKEEATELKKFLCNKHALGMGSTQKQSFRLRMYNQSIIKCLKGRFLTRQNLFFIRNSKASVETTWNISVKVKPFGHMFLNRLHLEEHFPSLSLYWYIEPIPNYHQLILCSTWTFKIYSISNPNIFNLGEFQVTL